MKIRHVAFSAGLALLAAAPLAWGQTSMTPADRSFVESMQQMNQATKSMPMTGKTDQDFVMMMVPHHEAAVTMAQTELKYGKSPFLKHMARKIIKSQDHEIKQMRRWLAKHPGTH